tara:strand:- start:2252 stop:3127 length:876 start_codon:yes stop_codon:yes gene_type:complete
MAQSFFWRVSLLGLTAILPLSFSLHQARGQEPTPAAESSVSAQISGWAASVVRDLKISNDASSRELTRKENSLLRWSNAIDGSVYGDSYLWTDHERPAAFLSIYARVDGPVAARRLTFQSLSSDPLTATLNNVAVWHPTEPGIQFFKLADVPSPSQKNSVRRLEILHLARQFRGRIQEVAHEDRFRELRLLTAPLYQYQSEPNHVENGALFAFVDGTDPELLLMVEARVEGERRSWYCAPVRQNHRRLQLSRGDDRVWDAPSIAPPFQGPKISDPNGGYFNIPWSVIADDR